MSRKNRDFFREKSEFLRDRLLLLFIDIARRGLLIAYDNEILERLIGTMVEGFARIEKKLDQMNRLKECMNGDRLLDNVDLAELLGVSQRTLARYRQEGKIKYYSVEKNGKSFYLASEIQSFLLQRGKNVVNNK